MGYCHVCQSAGSVNQYGHCEICRTEHRAEMRVEMPELSMVAIEKLSAVTIEELSKEAETRNDLVLAKAS